MEQVLQYQSRTHFIFARLAAVSRTSDTSTGANGRLRLPSLASGPPDIRLGFVACSRAWFFGTRIARWLAAAVPARLAEDADCTLRDQIGPFNRRRLMVPVIVVSHLLTPVIAECRQRRSGLC